MFFTNNRLRWFPYNDCTRYVSEARHFSEARQVLEEISTGFGRNLDTFWKKSRHFLEARQALEEISTSFGRNPDTFWKLDRFIGRNLDKFWKLDRFWKKSRQLLEETRVTLLGFHNKPPTGRGFFTMIPDIYFTQSIH